MTTNTLSIISKEKGKKTYNFIKKDGKEIALSDEVVKAPFIGD